MREALEFHERGNLDRGGITHLRQVIARQIDQHDVLREFLRVLEELGGKAMVLRGIATARTRPGDRIGPHPPPLGLDQSLRRGTHDLEVAATLVGQVQVVHVG